MSNRIKTKRRKKAPLPKIGRKKVRSNFELEVYKKIKELLPKSYTVDYEPDKIEYTIQHTYTPDFKITRPDGSFFYIEAKGNGRQFDSSVRQKMVAIKNQRPDLDIRMCFYADGKVGNTRKDGTFMRQSDWANKAEYDFCIRNVPKEWMK